jgi:S1-C subfamily serine protease
MSEMTNLQKHENFLYPVVRIHSEKAAGSGTIIYCKENPNSEGEYETFVLTNHHVIESCITYGNDWDSLLKRKVEKEKFKIPHVEIFSYVRLSEVDSSNRYKAQIIAYDQYHDLAVLKIESPRKFDNVAPMIPKDNVKDIKLFTEVVVGGCSLAHEPFCNFGQITFLKEIIEEKRYWMTNCNSVFGNSGGALFLEETGQLIGVPSRITAIQLGFGVDVMTWMGFAAHAERIYEFFEEQELLFLFDDEDTFEEAMERRKGKEKESLMAMKAEMMKDSK